jgi:hypothetical protein
MIATPLRSYGQAMSTARDIPEDDRLPSIALLVGALREASTGAMSTETALHNSILMVVCLGLLILEEIQP